MSNKNVRNIVWVDMETGGLSPQEHSLLSVALVCTNRNLDILAQTAFYVKHPTYRVSAKAMEVNGLDLAMLDEEGMCLEGSARILRNFLDEAAVGTDKPVLGGHNVSFDIGFLEALEPQLRQYVYHSRVDTKMVAEFLADSGVFVPASGMSLVKLAEQLGVEHQAPHQAMSDVMTTIGVYRALQGMVKRA